MRFLNIVPNVYLINNRNLPSWPSFPTAYENDYRVRGVQKIVGSNAKQPGSTVTRPRPTKPPLSMFQKFLVDIFINIVNPGHR